MHGDLLTNTKPERKSKFAQPHSSLIVIAFLASLFCGISRWTWKVGDGYIWHYSDDAMIAARVAQKFAEIGQPFFNHSEAVAASTSLVWPILLSPVFSLFDADIAIALVITLGAALSVFTAQTAARMIEPGRLKAAVFMSIALAPQVLFYGPNGWEHIPQAFLITLGLTGILIASNEAGTLRVPTAALVFISVSFLFRADSAPIILVVGLAWFLSHARYCHVATYGIASVLLLLPIGYFAAMMFYFGDYVPNTVHLKVLPFSQRITLGIDYVLDARLSGSAPFLLLLATIAALHPKVRRPGLALVLVAMIAHFFYVISVGGDVFTFGRFFLVLLPTLIAVIALQVLALFGHHVPRALAGFGIVVVIGILSAGSLTLLRDDIEAAIAPGKRDDESIKQQLRILGEVRQRLKPEDGSIGLHYLGIGFHLPAFHIVDFLGKAEPTIARMPARDAPIGHNKWDHPYAFDAYQIAALPVPAISVQRVTSEAVYSGVSYWDDAAREAIARGYVFVPPGHFGNVEGGIGLFVRQDLLSRFSGD